MERGGDRRGEQRGGEGRAEDLRFGANFEEADMTDSGQQNSSRYFQQNSSRYY